MCARFFEGVLREGEGMFFHHEVGGRDIVWLCVHYTSKKRMICSVHFRVGISQATESRVRYTCVRGFLMT